MEYYCAVCDKLFKDHPELTSSSGLDRHLVSVHYIPAGLENGKATLAENGLKKDQYPRDLPFIFRKSS